MDDLDFPGWEPAKSVQVVEGNGLTQVLVKGQPYMRWQSGDEGCTRLAIVQLYKCGLGTEEDLAAAFGRHINSVQNYPVASKIGWMVINLRNCPIKQQFS